MSTAADAGESHRAIGVVGLGAVGRRVVGSLRAAGVPVTTQPRVVEPPDALVVCSPSGSQFGLVRRWLGHVPLIVCTSDDADEVDELLRLVDPPSTVVVGAAFAPGLTCALARLAASRLDTADELHVAKFGTGGPACARAHHRALRGWATELRSGELVERPGGSGRELIWFPEPIRSHDCYRANLPDVALLKRSFPAVSRITARLAATRRDRMTSPLPMLRQPHPEGLQGAVRVEVRGARNGSRETIVFGATAPPAEGAAQVAGWAARFAPIGRGLLTVADLDVGLVAAVGAAGVRISEFTGSGGDLLA